MSCVAPVTAWQTSTGITFKRPHKLAAQIKIPCRNCVACKISRSREWAIRCMHEKQMNMESMFLTLTYNEDHLPENEGLNHDHFQLFMKRYRKSIFPKKIKYYMCGEYGENFGRPHYHALIFGHRFNDMQPHGEKGHFISAKLENLWGKGFCIIGNVTFESSAYVARYIMKKINGDQSSDHYVKCDPTTGELYQVEPEYNRMSTRPAIGKDWYEKYGSDIDDGTLHHKGKPVPIPAYYLKLLKKVKPDHYEELMKIRRKAAKEHQPSEYTLQCKKNRLERNQFKRKLK